MIARFERALGNHVHRYAEQVRQPVLESDQIEQGAVGGEAPNERVLVSEVEKPTVAMALFFEEFAARFGGGVAVRAAD